MTARPQDVALLPLPKWVPDPIIGHLLSDVDREFCEQYAAAYARANVTAALASAQAREDELRAEAVRIERENREGWKQAAHWRAEAYTASNRKIEAEARAERLDEALREWWEMKRPLKWSEAQHRETPCVNCATEADYRLAKVAALSTNAATQTGERNEAAE